LGCYARLSYYTTHVVVQGDIELLHDVQKAVDRLNLLTEPGTFTVEDNVYNTPWHNVVYVIRDPELKKKHPEDKDIAGLWYLIHNGDIAVISVLDNVKTVVIAHELGHAAGLEHSSDRRNLMYHKANYFNLTQEQKDIIQSNR
jgi:hypothetical protein